MLEPSKPKFYVHPPQTGDLHDVMRLAWKTTSRLYPFAFFEQIARHQPSYFRVVSETRTDRVLGFLIAARQPGTTDNFVLLAVEPQLVGLGLRRALLRAVQEQLSTEGERRFTVEVPASDRSAVEFYRREGFDLVGLEPSGDGADRLLLSKPIPPTATA